MSQTSNPTPFLERRPDGQIVDHAPRPRCLLGYTRVPLTPRYRPTEPTWAAPAPSTAAVPAGLLDAHAASAITGIPAAVLDGWARRDPARVPAARLVDGVVLFDPALLAVA